MRPSDWYMHMDERKAQAIRAGWTITPIQQRANTVYFATSAGRSFQGIGFSEDEAWSDILGDVELWDEVTAAINAVLAVAVCAKAGARS